MLGKLDDDMRAALETWGGQQSRTTNGYVRLCFYEDGRTKTVIRGRWVIEYVDGITLSPTEKVVRKNRDRSDDRRDNLIVVKNQSVAIKRHRDNGRYAHVKGDGNGSVKVPDAQIPGIRSQWTETRKQGISMHSFAKSIAPQYGVCFDTIKGYLTRRKRRSILSQE